MMDTNVRIFGGGDGGRTAKPELPEHHPLLLLHPTEKSLKALLAFGLILMNVVVWPFAYRYVRTMSVPGQPPSGSGLPLFEGGAYLGFDVSNATIPKEEILGGGPPKDGIPAILKPKFVAAYRARYLNDSDLVVGIVHGDIARAYPLRILVWHEIVNDWVGDLPVAVTYCPLCGTCMVFDRHVNGVERTFGVSGLLHNSDVLMYDHQSESLWSQLKMEAVAGKQAGQGLTWIASEQMTWKAWKKRYPRGEVLSTDTGFRRDYENTPYGGYETSNQIMFPVPMYRQEIPVKAWVVGVIVNGVPKAYLRSALQGLPGGTMEDTVGGTPVVVTYDADARWARITDADGVEIPNVAVYWFAWQGFYPETELFAQGGGQDTDTR